MTLTEAFAILPKPRTGPVQRHDLREMILMALCAVLCGGRRRMGGNHLMWLRQYVLANEGAPSHDTFGRVFRLLVAAIFEQVGEVAKPTPRDGADMNRRGALTHITDQTKS